MNVHERKVKNICKYELNRFNRINIMVYMEESKTIRKNVEETSKKLKRS